MGIFKKIFKALLLCILLCFIAVPFYSESYQVYGEPGGVITEDPGDSSGETPAIPEEPADTGGSSSTTQPNEQQPSFPSGSEGANVSQAAGAFSSVGHNSIDTRLKELTISCGQLVPEFSPDIYEYTVYVSEDAYDKTCVATAVPVNASSTSITAEGPSEFTDKDVMKKVIVEGSDGSKSEYTIDVHIIKDTEILVNNVLYAVSNDIDPHGLPGEFEVSDVQFAGESIKAVKSSDGNLILICFRNSKDESDLMWYMIGDDGKSKYPVQILEYNGQKYILISEGQQLVYGSNSDKVGYYVVDTATGDIRFSIKEDANNLNKSTSGISYITVILAVSTTLLMFICIFVIIKYKKRSASNCENKYFRPYVYFENDENGVENIKVDFENKPERVPDCENGGEKDQ